MFNKNHKIGEIAAKFPKATNIFMDYEIDFCCGGDRPLYIALEEKGIDEEVVVNKLNKSYEEFKNRINEDVDWTTAPMADLIDYVVDKHHTFMREEMPVTEKLLTKILRVHYADNGETLSKLHKLFGTLKAEIEEHLIKEEEVLFPLIKEYEKNPNKETLKKAIKVMNETEAEHENAGDILKEMRKITNGYKVPQTGCSSFRKTYEKLESIESDLFQHIHLENNILFTRLIDNSK